MLRDARTARAAEVHQAIGGEEFPPDLYDADGETQAASSRDLRVGSSADEAARSTTRQLFAMGSDVGEHRRSATRCSTSLFLREHNRIARELAERSNPSWDEDRVFDDGAQHPHRAADQGRDRGVHQPHRARTTSSFASTRAASDKQPWIRPNWVAVEFNLLYRWHSLIPSTLHIDGETLTLEETRLRRTAC